MNWHSIIVKAFWTENLRSSFKLINEGRGRYLKYLIFIFLLLPAIIIGYLRIEFHYFKGKLCIFFIKFSILLTDISTLFLKIKYVLIDFYRLRRRKCFGY